MMQCRQRVVPRRIKRQIHLMFSRLQTIHLAHIRRIDDLRLFDSIDRHAHQRSAVMRNSQYQVIPTFHFQMVSNISTVEGQALMYPISKGQPAYRRGDCLDAAHDIDAKISQEVHIFQLRIQAQRELRLQHMASCLQRRQGCCMNNPVNEPTFRLQIQSLAVQPDFRGIHALHAQRRMLHRDFALYRKAQTRSYARPEPAASDTADASRAYE